MKKLITILLTILVASLTACSDSTSPDTSDLPTQPAAAPTTTSVDPQPKQHSEDLLNSKYLRFARLTTEDGLSGDQTYHIAQDSHGFMWIATSNGLSRYDGSRMKAYLHVPDDPSSLSHNAVRAMDIGPSGHLWLGTYGGGLNWYDSEQDAFVRYQHDPDNPLSLSSDLVRSVYVDRDETVWVGTAAGLNRLDRDSREFTYYQHDPDDPNSLSHDLVWSILKDNAGVLWVGTENGFNRFNPDTEQFVRFQHDADDPSSLSHNTVREIFEDQFGILWLSTPGGLTKLDRDRTQFTQYLHDSADPQSLSNNTVTGVFEDSAGRLWISTWGGGLNRFDRDVETFTSFRHDSGDPYSLGADTVFDVYEDEQGMFWVASDGGISIFDGGRKPFHHYRAISHLPNTLSNNVVRALHAGQSGAIWVGTSGGGLHKFDSSIEEFTNYRHDPDDPISLSDDTVRAIFEDRMGIVWVGTSQPGLNRFDPRTETLTHFPHDAEDPQSISKGSIMGINEDSDGTLWISTWGGGLNAFDRDSGQFTRYQHDPTDPQTLSNNQVITVVEDREGELWIGTFGGLNKFDRETKTFTRYLHDPAEPQSLGHDSVTAMLEDQTGVLWIGTLGGLDKFDSKNELFTHYTTADGLPSDLIWGILEDDQGRIWLSTASGLSRFDPQTESFENYDQSDGLQSNTFLNFSSYSKSPSGEFFFGGSNGFNAFYPDQIFDNPHLPPVVITDFQLANKPVPIGPDSPLQASILGTDGLLLSYLDRVLTFEFAVLNFRANEKSRYRFMMEGFEEEWNEVDNTRRFATYTNLDPGDYVFRVIASNNDGVWNEEGTSLKITITPPWWETTWFRIGLGVLVIGLLVVGYRWRVSSLQARERELEAQIRLMFENSPVGIALSTNRGDIITFNKALLEILRISEEDLLREGVANFYADAANRAELLAAVQESGSVQQFGVPLIRRDGSSFFGSINMSRLVLEGNEVLLAMLEDVTGEITAEQQAAVIEERERLARELHDSVTQTLFSASVLAQSAPRLMEKNPAVAKQNMEQQALLIRGALAEMRTLLFELRPSELTEQNISQLFDLLAESTRARTQANVTLNVEMDNLPPENVVLAYYRIAQESLNNIAKHALAGEVVIDLTCNPGSAKLLVKDDGRGFDLQTIPAGHLGVSIMQERAQKIEAIFEIDSEIGRGTKVNVSWPAGENESKYE
jgi:PAS domain S-box-containing protein